MRVSSVSREGMDALSRNLLCRQRNSLARRVAQVMDGVPMLHVRNLEVHGSILLTYGVSCSKVPIFRLRKLEDIETRRIFDGSSRLLMPLTYVNP